MRKIGVVVALSGCLLMGMLLTTSSDSAFGGDGKKGLKLDAKRLKLILNKLDPEIKAAQASLQKAKSDIQNAQAKIKAAIANEVFTETGATEGKVIDQLKLASKHATVALTEINAALKNAAIAQLVDTGK